MALEDVTDRSRLSGTDDPSWREAEEQLALLDLLRPGLQEPDFLAGRVTPVFFGSAVSNFGVRLLLDALIELAPSPQGRVAANGDLRRLDDPFAGLVFKIQANMNPRHRDRLAFVRVCSGRFEAGMKAVNARTGRQLTLNHAHELFGRERESLTDAYPGDVVGLVNATDLRIGDTLHAGQPVAFPALPTLAPERFVIARNGDTRRYKQFQRGLVELEQEGVISVLRRPDRGDQEPILAGVGEMQFEVMAHRLREEYGATVALEPAAFKVARRTDASGERALGLHRAATLVYRSDGTPLALFESEFHLRRVEAELPSITLDAIVS